MKRFDVIIIGAGPYGLSAAAHLRAAGVNAVVFGEPMSFWSRHMPARMLLRSPSYATDLSDPAHRFGLERYRSQLHPTIPGPVPLQEFISYGLWFQQQLVADVDQRQVGEVRKNGSFALTLQDREQVIAPRVVVAAGIKTFPVRPPEFAHLPSALVSHTSEHSSFDRFRDRPVAVIGAGQSALESAALLHEAGVQVQVLARSPQVRWLREKGPAWFTLCERLLWGPAGVGPAGISQLVERPTLYRTLPRSFQDRYGVLRPAGAAWLRERLRDVPICTGRSVISATRERDQVRLHLDDGSHRDVDHVMLATGYRVDLSKYEFLSRMLLTEIDQVAGFPRLNPGFESSVPGLYFLGAPAAWSFGPLLRFVAGTHFAAHALTAQVVRGLRRHESRSRSLATVQHPAA